MFFMELVNSVVIVIDVVRFVRKRIYEYIIWVYIYERGKLIFENMDYI